MFGLVVVILLWLLLCMLLLLVYLLVVLVVFVLGVWVCNVVGCLFGVDDYCSLVIDEFVG